MIFFASVYSQLIFHWKDRSLVIKQNHSKCAKVMGSKWIQNRPRCAVLAFMFQISYNAAKLCFSDSSSLVTSCVFTDKKEVDTWPINLSFQIKLAKKKKTYFNQHSSHPRLILCESTFYSQSFIRCCTIFLPPVKKGCMWLKFSGRCGRLILASQHGN